MNFTCEFKSGTSKKGNAYSLIEITFPNGYKKAVFLDRAEIAMIHMLQGVPSPVDYVDTDSPI